MSLPVFYRVIVPLLTVLLTTLICISTPLGRENFYSELCELRDAYNAYIFNVIKIAMSCERCKGTEHEAECEHPIPDAPSWKDDDNKETIEAFYGADRKTELDREIKGLISDGENMAFKNTYLKRFFKKPVFTEPHIQVDTVYVAIDPNGGGKTSTGSDTAIVSFFYDGPAENVVVRKKL